MIAKYYGDNEELYKTQRLLEKAEKLLNSITTDSNPVYLKMQVEKYYQEKKES